MNSVPVINGATPVFPIKEGGVEMNWGMKKETLQDLLDKGFVQFSEGYPLQPYIFKYVSTKYKKKFEEGNDNAVRGFIQHNDCVELNCDIRIEKDNIELH